MADELRDTGELAAAYEQRSQLPDTALGQRHGAKVAAGVHNPRWQLTEDSFLGGQLTLLQPRDGYRAGLDAVLLAASYAPDPRVGNARLLDLGCGVGTVALCAARRLPAAVVHGVEVQADLVALAQRNAASNGLDCRFHAVCCDITEGAAAQRAVGLGNADFDAVLSNPPFHESGEGTPAGAIGKRRAHAMDGVDLTAWVLYATRALKPGGTFTLVHKTEALPQLLATLAPRFGEIMVRPLQPRCNQPARRILVRARKGSRAPFVLLPPINLHGEPGVDRPVQRFASDVAAALQTGAGFDAFAN
ncbi:MAG: methyltransferase [Pseudomonadota bacterium]